jgi:hypothetical protein
VVEQHGRNRFGGPGGVFGALRGYRVGAARGWEAGVWEVRVEQAGVRDAAVLGEEETAAALDLGGVRLAAQAPVERHAQGECGADGEETELMLLGL